MTLFDESKSIVENLNYLSGPIIALLGVVAIFQLRLSKKAMYLTSKRQAAEIATEQVKFYGERIIATQNEIYNYKKSKKYNKISVENIESFTFEELKSNTSINNIKLKLDEYKDTIDKTSVLLNLLEGFAIYFTKGIADEEIAYSSIGSTYCHTVEGLTFDLCIIRSEDDLGAYQNVIKLYQIWNPKLISEQLKRELSKKQQALKDTKIQTVDILGTK